MDEKIHLNPPKLDVVMKLVGISAKRLAKHCHVDHSLISYWQRGARPMTERSRVLDFVISSILALDINGRLGELLAPYMTAGENIDEALKRYLLTDDLPALPARAAPPILQESGSYITQQHVLLGEKGYRKAVLLMLDYVMTLPPGRQILVCAHNGFDLYLNNVPFTLQFLQKMLSVVKRGTTFLLINRRGFGMENDAHFARFWLVAHLKGIVRSRYYDGAPPEEYYVASIPGYWSGEAEVDPTAEDGLITIMYTDPRNIRRAKEHCEAYIQKSIPASQYGFLNEPLGQNPSVGGDADNARGWKPGPLPRWNVPGAIEPDGGFSAICRVPSIGIMTRAEFGAVLGKDDPPPIPEFLFSEDGYFANSAHYIILCRDDIKAGLRKERARNEPLSALLHRRAFLTRGLLAASLKRLVEAMEQNENFEVALLPQSAFAKLELEMVCWRNSASVGWLQDGSESVYANDPITSGSFHAAITHTWNKLHKGWKRKSSVLRNLRKWLAGKELDQQEPDSVFVQNWDAL